MTLWVYRTSDKGVSWESKGVYSDTSDDYIIGGLDHLAMDTNINGDTLYIAAKNEVGDPQILSIPSDFSEIAGIEYNPGAGSSANVICGDITDQVWAAGHFGGPKVVRQSDFLGIYWSDVNNSISWVDEAAPFLVGPEDDELVLVINGDFLRETYFVGNDGPYWFTWDDSIPIKFNALDRLALYLDEVLFGSYFTTNPPVYFTPNIGIDYEDVSYSLFGRKVTSIIFGITN